MSTDLQRGTDIARYYQDLLDNPPSLVSYNPDALKILIERARKGLSPKDVFTVGSLAGPLSSKGWDVVEHESFYFPEDNGPHYDIRKEWWYISCTFDVPGQNPLSLLIIFTRRGTVPAYMRRAGQDGKNSQVVFLQTYVTIPSKNDHYSFRSWADGNSTTMKSSPFELSTPENFSIKSVSGDSLFPIDIVIKNDSKMDIHITLTSPNNPSWFPQGNNGCAPCISGMGYRYYSSPNITAQGTVTVESNSFNNLKGSAWMDHNWESRVNPLGYTKNYYLRAFRNIGQFFTTPRINIRWNWFFVRLDNGTEITSALIPAPDQNTKEDFDLTNTTMVYDNDKNIKREDISGQVNYVGFIKSPTGTTYPLGWNLSFPSEDLNITLTPTVANQFCYSGDNAEFMGAGVVVDGTKDGKKISGTGFVKCIHYESDHEFINNSLKSLDYTSDKINDIIQSFYPVKPNGWLFALSLFIAILPLLLIILVIVFMVLIIQMNVKDKKNA